MKEITRVRLVAGLGWVVLTFLCWLLYPPTMSDTMARYAPMAEAFARGEWTLAFHPRFGVIFQVCAGTLAFLGLPGDLACQATAIGALLLAGVAMWYVAERLFDRETAWWTFALVALCEVFLGNAMDGLRDPVKCLAFAWLGRGVVERRAIWFALGLFVLMTVVSYGFALALVLLLGWYAWQRRSWWPILLFLLGTVVETVMVHAYTGYWVPVPQIVRIVGRFL